MIRNFVVIVIAAIICLTGCVENRSSVKAVDVPGIDTPLGMIDYLQRRNLPALKSVEVWQNEYGPGLKLVTSHYEIYTTLLEPLMLSQIPGFVESAYRGYNRQLPKPIETTAGKFTVYIFAEREQWEDFTTSFVGPQAPLYLKIKAGAYYLNGACVAYNIGREMTFSVIGHEGWHQFNSRHFKFRLPSWLDEGVAMLFEVSRYDRGLFYFEPDRNLQRLGALRKTLQRGKIIPLKNLISLNPGEVIIVNDEAVGAFYSQAYTLVRFLREDEYGRRMSNYQQMLLGGLNGSWPLNDTGKRIAADRNIPLTVAWNRAVGLLLFEQYIGDDFAQLEQKYVQFCRKIVYHVRVK